MITTLTKRSTGLFAGIILALLAIAPSTLHAGEQIPFRASWDSQITLTPVNPPIFAVSGAGVGSATHLGKMAAHSVVELVNLATLEGAASYRFTAANGDEVLVDFVFTATPVSPTDFAIQGIWQVTGGTGRFDGATGTGTYEGQVEFTGLDTAVGHFELQGSISSPGSLQ